MVQSDTTDMALPLVLTCRSDLSIGSSHGTHLCELMLIS